MNNMNALSERVASGDFTAIPLARTMGPSALPALQPFLTSAEAEPRELAFLCLGEIASPTLVPTFFQGLSDLNVSVRHIALRGLRKIATPDLFMALLSAVSTERESTLREGLLTLALNLGHSAASATAETDVLTLVDNEPNLLVRTLGLLLLARLAAQSATTGRAPQTSSQDRWKMFHSAALGLGPADLANLLGRPGLVIDLPALPTLLDLLSNEEPALWVYSDLRPDAPPFRRVCDFAADRTIDILERAGVSNPKRNVAYSEDERSALCVAAKSLTPPTAARQ